MQDCPNSTTRLRHGYLRLTWDTCGPTVEINGQPTLIDDQKEWLNFFNTIAATPHVAKILLKINTMIHLNSEALALLVAAAVFMREKDKGFSVVRATESQRKRITKLGLYPILMGH